MLVEQDLVGLKWKNFKSDPPAPFGIVIFQDHEGDFSLGHLEHLYPNLSIYLYEFHVFGFPIKWARIKVIEHLDGNYEFSPYDNMNYIYNTKQFIFKDELTFASGKVPKKKQNARKKGDCNHSG